MFLVAYSTPRLDTIILQGHAAVAY